MIGDILRWLNDPLNWQGSGFTPGILAQTGAHIGYSGLALLIALLIGLPLGLAVGHRRTGRWLVSTANAVRALPTVGLLVLLVVMVSPHFSGQTTLGYVIPTEIVLVLLALPPILAGAYSGIENVDPAVRDAAYGVGMTSRQVLFGVELPNALPLIWSGIRSAALQVIATASIAAYVTLGGLGRFIYDGLAQRDFPQMIGGGILVAALALLTDLVLAGLQRATVSPGVSRRFRARDDREDAAPDGREVAVDEADATVPST